MAGPAAVIAAAAAVAGPVIKGFGGFQAGKANARAARAEANAALRTGVAQDDQIRRDARRAAGEAIAAMGANGGGLGTGSALDVLRDIELESGLDRLRVQTEAGNRFGSLQREARNAKRQGAFDLLAGVTEAAGKAASMGGGGGGGG